MNIKRSLFILMTVFALAGCSVFPGVYMSSSGKQQIDTNAVDINELVDIYVISPSLLESLRETPVIAQPNEALDRQILAYEYRIGVGDVLNVTVWEHPELTIPAGSYRSASEAGNWVHADGSIFYPYIGKVKVAGKTVSQVRSDISRRLATYIESPQVDVSIAAFRSQRVYVSGEVEKPGTQPVTNVPLTLLDAFNRAGGLTQNADWQRVILTRNGREQVISLQSLMQYGDLQQNRLMEAGDILYVPRNDALKVFVMGEVKKPATLTIDRSGMSLTEALSKGDINQQVASATGIFVIRPVFQERKGEERARLANIYQLDLSDAAALAMGTEFQLKPYDIVYVTAAPVARWNRLIQQLIPTITGFNELSEATLRIRKWDD